MAKKALASFSRTMAARTSSSISARSNARECTASMRDKRSLSKLLLIEGPASRRRIICAPFNRQRRYQVALTTDVLARLLVHGHASGSPVAGFFSKTHFTGLELSITNSPKPVSDASGHRGSDRQQPWKRNDERGCGDATRDMKAHQHNNATVDEGERLRASPCRLRAMALSHWCHSVNRNRAYRLSTMSFQRTMELWQGIC
jgi:hypothetical protein